MALVPYVLIADTPSRPYVKQNNYEKVIHFNDHFRRTLI
ncbi:MAG: hypothetical protein JWP45_701 [Mucilaginibacter sp.]|nr:hypothetical protein [Mucilaginibacter sp.]